MGRVCSTHGGDDKIIQNVIKMNVTEIGLEGVHWIHLVQDRDQWAVVNRVMTLRVP
jgi:hypothetical protein